MTAVLTAPRRAPLPPGVIARPRLEALLEVERPLTVVTGPAGAGKTVLLTAFAAAHDAAWLSLTPRHNDPATLTAAIEEALRDAERGARARRRPPRPRARARRDPRAARAKGRGSSSRRAPIPTSASRA